MVFYRKYRPQSLTDLYGQESIKHTLQNAFEKDRLSHAYLFYGPRGTGKTSTARILAKMVNCEMGKEKAPCNKCQTCISITDGSNLDLIEIDAASNRGIDDIRDLRETIKLAPTSAKKKVYIIDEVHMLTNEAFNALLKTLEEPPSHVLFILATTEIHKVPQTILSRTQRLDFKNASEADLIAGLQKVAKEEKLEFEEDALRLIAKRSEGSFRDSLKLLDQISSVGEKITAASVEEAFRSGNFEVLISLLENISQSDSSKGLSLLSKEVEEGINIKEFLISLTDLMRSILLIKHGAAIQVKGFVDEVQYKKLEDLTAAFSSQKIIQVLDSFQKAYEKMKFASIPSLPLEVAVVESCLEEVSKGEFVKAAMGSTETVEVIQTKKVDNLEKTQSSSMDNANINVTEISSKTEISVKVQDDVLASSADSAERALLLDKWTYILEAIRPYNYSLEALLKQVKLISSDNGSVVLEVPYSFHQRILEAPKSRNLLESVLTDILGKPARVKCRLGVRPVRIEELANVELAEDDEVIRVAAEIFSSEPIS